MILKRIKLENIRSHVNTELEFDEGITVFTGKTGCGKSTILMSIEYVLFGSNAVSSRALLRRGADKGRIVLEFEEGGKKYIISRGFKRRGDKVSSDPDAIEVYVDGVKQDIVGRENDLTEFVCKVLNYPVSSAKNLFEVTSYTKQDEIRKLIEMKSSERQEYIDNILEISKYLNTYKNLKPVLDYLKARIESFNLIKTEMENMEKEIVEKESELLKKKGRKEILAAELKKVEDKLKEIIDKEEQANKEYNKLKELRDRFLSIKSTLERLNKSIESEEERIRNIEKEITELKDKISSMGETKDLKKIVDVIGILRGKISSLEQNKENLALEVKKLKEVGEGKCPVCKQDITSDHINKVEEEYKNKSKELDKEIQKLKSEIEVLETEMEKAEEKEKISSELKEKEVLLSSLKERLNQTLEERNALESEAQKISFDSNRFESLDKEIKELSSRKLDLTSQVSSIKRELEMVNDEVKELEEEIKLKKERYKDLEKEGKNIKKLERLLEVLTRMREDIRSIRDVVRKKFLNDFRQSFLNNFEDIRTENEYVVDIKDDYEPVAYGNNVEVPIDHLSGGERTCVAIAYRLALAKIAAEMSSIHPSELLILDEPTTGLDKEDIKQLPVILRNIKTIPQILIVTHEDVLKEAADNKYEISKTNGTSEVIKV